MRVKSLRADLLQGVQELAETQDSQGLILREQMLLEAEETLITTD